MDGVTGDAASPVSASTVSASTVSATLNYLRPGSKRNRLYVAPGGHLTTTEYAPTTVTITNGRPHADDFGLDRSGFTLLRHASAAGSIFAPRPYHRWWFFPGLEADEALLFKLHDTDHSVAWRVPHTAFEAPYAATANPRESVELRSIAFFY